MYSPPSIPNHLRCCMDNIYIYIYTSLPPFPCLFIFFSTMEYPRDTGNGEREGEDEVDEISVNI